MEKNFYCIVILLMCIAIITGCGQNEVVSGNENEHQTDVAEDKNGSEHQTDATEDKSGNENQTDVTEEKNGNENQTDVVEEKNGNENQTDILENENMPEIVFDYTFFYEANEPYSYMFVFIDKYGNVYYGDNEIYFCNAEEKMHLYQNLINDTDCKKINVADMKQLQQKYDLLKQIVKDGNNKVTIKESVLDVCLGQYTWTGYYYDENGNLNTLTLYGEGDSSYINNDNRAKEIAEWISGLKK